MFLDQVNTLPVWLLLGSSVVSVAIGGVGDAAVILAVVVPGDLLLLSRGTYVPADARLLSTERLTVDESAAGSSPRRTAAASSPKTSAWPASAP